MVQIGGNYEVNSSEETEALFLIVLEIQNNEKFANPSTVGQSIPIGEIFILNYCQYIYIENEYTYIGVSKTTIHFYKNQLTRVLRYLKV